MNKSNNSIRNRVFNIIKSELDDYRALLRNMPSVCLIFFVLSVVLMNLFANKELISYKYLALDCGFLLSWLSFLCMDMLTKRFGAKAAIKISLFSVGVNFVACFFFYIISLVPGNWGEFYSTNSNIANQALDNTIGGSWYVLIGSMISFSVASIVNALINVSVGKFLKQDNFITYAIRSYTSTIVGQFIDNMLFALIVSHVLFGWTLTQCFACSIIGAIAELLSEVLFSPIGFKVCRRWEKQGVGQSYIEHYINN